MWERLGPHRHTLLLILLPLAPLFMVVVGGHAIGPWDDVRAVVLGEGRVRHGWDILMVDACLQFAPWRKLVLESWAGGQVPFLNPYALFGQPLLANSQSGALYPPHILLGVLRVPLAVALTLLAWFHLAWAGLGARKWAMVLGASEAGGLVAGALFSLSAFLVIWTPLASVPTTCAWIPWALAFTTQLARGEGGRAAVGRLALCLGMMILAGHLQFVAFGFMAVALTAVYWLAATRRIKAALPLAVATALGFAMALPHLGPALEFSSQSHRRGAATTVGFHSYQSSAIQPYELGGLAAIQMLGSPREGVETRGFPVPVPGSWVQYAKPGGHPAESALTIGPLAFALLAGWRRGKTGVSGSGGALACVGALGLLVALGTPFNALLYYGVPGWSSTGSPGRAAVLFVMAAAVGAGLAWRENPDAKTSRIQALAAIGSVLLAIATLSVLRAPTSWVPVGPTVASLQALALVQAMFVAMVAAALAAGAVLAVKWRLPMALAAVAVTSFGVLLTSPVGIPTTSPWPELAEPNRRVAFITPSWPLPLPPAQAPGAPNIATLFRIRSATAYDSLLSGAEVAHFAALTEQSSPFPPTNGNMLMITSPEARLDHLGATDVVQPDGVVRPLPSDPAMTKVLAVDTGGYTVQGVAGEPLAVPYWRRPGMVATQNGKPVTLTGETTITSSPLAESGPVRISYAPPGFGLQLAIGLAALLVSAGIATLRSGAERNNSAAETIE